MISRRRNNLANNGINRRDFRPKASVAPSCYYCRCNSANALKVALRFCLEVLRPGGQSALVLSCRGNRALVYSSAPCEVVIWILHDWLLRPRRLDRGWSRFERRPASRSLVGFPSLIEMTSGSILLWCLHADVDEARRERIEAISLRLVGVWLVVLVIYVATDSVKSLIRRKWQTLEACTFFILLEGGCTAFKFSQLSYSCSQRAYITRRSGCVIPCDIKCRTQLIVS